MGSDLLSSSDDWTIDIVGNEGTSAIDYSISKTDLSVTIEAPISDNNTNVEHTLQVSALYNGRTISSKIIPIKYVAVTGAEISINNDLLKEGNTAVLTIKYLPEDTTKQEWAENNSEWILKGGTVSGNIFSLSDKADATAKLVINNTIHSNTLNILYDKVLAQKTQSGGYTITGKSEEELSWFTSLYKNIKGDNEYGKIGNSLTISTLRGLRIDNTWSTKIGGIDQKYDLEWLQYITFTEDTFDVPNIKFSNLGIPEVDKVNCNVYVNDFTDYETITFNKNLLQANIQVSGNSPLSKIKLNFGKCINITKIYRATETQDLNSISLYFNYDLSGTYSTTELITNYPPNIEQIGNYRDDESEPIAMFNGHQNGASITVERNGYYSINLTPFVDNKMKIGRIYNYTISNPTQVISMMNPSVIEKTQYAFYELAGLLTNTNFTGLTTIGTFSFGSTDLHSSKNYDISIVPSQITYIGNNAFRYLPGKLKVYGSSTAPLELSSVTNIGESAFAFMNNSIDIVINSNTLVQIGSDAFVSASDVTTSHKITIEGDSRFVFTDSSFGSDKKNKLYITSGFKDKLTTDELNALLDRVILYVDNNLITAI